MHLQLHYEEVISLNSNNQSIGRWISILYRYNHCYIDKELKKYHIGSGQSIFLNALLRKDGISQEELSHILMIDKATTARALAKLEKEGYVQRKIDPKDRRAYRIFVTDKAKEMERIFFNILYQWTEILSSGMDQEQKELVLDMLQKMAYNARNYIKQKHNE